MTKQSLLIPALMLSVSLIAPAAYADRPEKESNELRKEQMKEERELLKKQQEEEKELALWELPDYEFFLKTECYRS